MFTPRLLTLILPLALVVAGCTTPAYKDSRHIYAQILEQQAGETHEQNKFTPELVSLLATDAGSGNYLFRGNMPIDGNEFSYNQLRAAMKKAAPGGVLPEQYFLIDISLVNSINPNEAADLAIERQFWKVNSHLGQVINHPVYGSLTSPNDYPEQVRKKLERIPTLSSTDVLLENIQSLLLANQANAQPLVLYIHCEAGKDRTGEVAAAYAMKYQGSSYLDAYANAKRIAGRDLSSFSRNELQWYAYYLREVQNVQTIGDIR
jgi:hypothetical protein